MKTNILLSFFLVFSLSSFAQEKQTETEYKWGVGIQVNTIDKFSQYENSFEEFNTNTSQGTWKNKSLSLGLIGYYNLNENTFLRFRAGITIRDIAYHRDERDEYSGTTPATYRIIDASVMQKRYHYNPGILWRMSINRLFEMHGGFELPISFYSNYKEISNSTEYDSNSTIVLQGNSIETAPGGYSFGIGGVIGFNAHVCKRFSIGADFSAALLYLKLGGEIVQTVSSTIPIISTNTSHYLFKMQGVNYSGEKLSINASYLF